MPTDPSTPATQPDPGDLADLDALAEELNRHGLPSLRLTPPGKTPYVDTGLPQNMAPGLRIYAQAGTYFWPDYRPIAPTDHPTTAADIIAHQLHTTTSTSSSQHSHTHTMTAAHEPDPANGPAIDPHHPQPPPTGKAIQWT